MPLPATRDIEFEVTADRTIRGTVHHPPELAGPSPLVVLCHGFKGFKDWGPWPWFAAELASRGFVVHRFTFSLAGVGPALDRHDEPDKFARNTYGAEMEDLAMVLARREEWAPPGAILDRCGVVGHSRGGTVTLLAGGETGDMDAVVTLGSPGHSRRHDDRTIEAWRKQGYLEVPNARTGEVYRLDVSIIDDYLAHEEKYDVTRQIGRRVIPTRVIHGTADQTVPVEEADWIHDALDPGARDRVILDGAGHTFAAGHPFTSPEPELAAALDQTTDWFQRHLRESS